MYLSGVKMGACYEMMNMDTTLCEYCTWIQYFITVGIQVYLGTVLY